jgi:arylsulfatase A-like enzyme
MNLTSRSHLRISQVLLISAWFGLLAGLIEGITANFLRGVPGFAIRVSPEILWIAPAFDLVFFLLTGLGLFLASYVIPRRISVGVWVGLFSGMTLFGLLLLVGQLHQLAALILSAGVGMQIGRRLRDKEAELTAFAQYTFTVLIAGALFVGIVGARWDSWRERQLVGDLPKSDHREINVLLIVLDTLRADHLSSYGYQRRTTPNIDRLAQRGVLFENTFANSSWTLPSHASLLTGRLPFEHKADWWDPLDGTYPTLGDVLAERGYRTAAFAANTSYVSPEWGLVQGFSHFEAYGSSLADDVVRTVYGRKLALNILPHLGYFDIPGRKRASQVNEEFFRWLEGVDGRPFFVMLNYFDLHDPYLTVDSYQSKFSDVVTRGDLVNFQFQPHTHRRKPSLTAKEIQAEIDSYDGCLAYLDAEIGRLFSELAKRGLDSNTLIIVTSDHGESFGNHDLFGHGNSLYLETLHVPLILSWPEKIPVGARISQIVSLHQIPSTVMELIGEDSTPFPGDSLVSFWSGTADQAAIAPILSEVSPGRFKAGPPNYPTALGGGLKSLISNQWHFILSESGSAELYAWRQDRHELENLAETPAGRVAVERFKHHLDEIIKKN